VSHNANLHTVQYCSHVHPITAADNDSSFEIKQAYLELVLTGPMEGAASLGDTYLTFATPETAVIRGVFARMSVHLVNPSDNSFGTAVITPRWLFVLAAATPGRWATRYW
jgi:hypothetical protein